MAAADQFHERRGDIDATVEFFDDQHRFIASEPSELDDSGVPAEVVIFRGRRWRRHPRTDEAGRWPYRPTREYRPTHGESNVQWLDRVTAQALSAEREVRVHERRVGINRGVASSGPRQALDGALLKAMEAHSFAKLEHLAAQAAVLRGRT